jgi:hypothetical protein
VATELNNLQCLSVLKSHLVIHFEIDRVCVQAKRKVKDEEGGGETPKKAGYTLP